MPRRHMPLCSSEGALVYGRVSVGDMGASFTWGARGYASGIVRVEVCRGFERYAGECRGTGVCEKTFLLREPLPSKAAATAATPLQPLIWCF